MDGAGVESYLVSYISDNVSLGCMDAGGNLVLDRQ